ncbi:MAG: FAD-binding protein, partial [Myxococcota bacterium]|nr:FAD-binding protein [Myxococcota bacterium]
MEERMAQWGILPPVDGAWLVHDEALEACAQDFGKVISERPALVLRPGSIKDVQCAMRFAAREGLCVAARGDAHSAGGQMQMKDGLVIDMTALSEVYRLGPDSIHVGAGISWRRLVETTLERNLTPPVLTDWLDVTVGGTLSMGGLGFSSYWDGTQMDHILELEVVTGDGAVHRVSPSHQPQLFDAVRGTHGQIALIVGVTLPLRRAPT